MNKFGTWLTEELKKRDMNQSDLARASNITTAQISRIISGNRGVGEQALTAIAHALQLPPDLVFEKAGILPPKPELSPIKRRLAHLMEDMPDSDVELAIAMLEQRQQLYKRNPKARPAE